MSGGGRAASAFNGIAVDEAPVDDAMVANGVVGQSDASDARRAFEDPSFLYRGGLVVAVWGRRKPSQDV
jgi:hypothetical protein